MLINFRITSGCTAPLLFIINAMVNNRNADPYWRKNALNRFLFRVCAVLGALGHTDMNGPLPWDEARARKDSEEAANDSDDK